MRRPYRIGILRHTPDKYIFHVFHVSPPMGFLKVSRRHLLYLLGFDVAEGHRRA